MGPHHLYTLKVPILKVRIQTEEMSTKWDRRATCEGTGMAYEDKENK